MKYKMVYQGEQINTIADLNNFRELLNRKVKASTSINHVESFAFTYYLLNEVERLLLNASEASINAF